MIFSPYPVDDLAALLPGLSGDDWVQLYKGGPKAGDSWGGDCDVLLAAPSGSIIVRDGVVLEDGREIGGAIEHDAFALLQRRLDARKGVSGNIPDDAPGVMKAARFLSGAAGYIGYEMARYRERVLADLPPVPGALPEMAVGFYDAALIRQRQTGEAVITGRTREAVETLRALLERAWNNASAQGARPADAVDRTQADEEDFLASVEACKARILDGSIFQANITRRLRAVYPQAAWRDIAAVLFQRLTRDSASAYSACLQFEEGCILSDSPEKFLEVRRQGAGLTVIAEPVKGTRRRHDDPVADKAALDELIGDEKDRAENIMIADLVRNDLSQVCRDHSIREEAVCVPRSFASVHHLVSIISGTLRDGLGAIDALAASFPCGSITGAPKIRAMQVIADLEREGRGVYCSAIGLFDDRGGAMVSVPIRTATLEAGDEGAALTYGSGGGITVLSDPQAEYRETIDKAAPYRRLIGRRIVAEAAP